jgi:hypothetical protein
MTGYLVLTKGDASFARRGPLEMTRETGRVVENALALLLANLENEEPEANLLKAIEEAIVSNVCSQRQSALRTVTCAQPHRIQKVAARSSSPVQDH